MRKRRVLKTGLALVLLAGGIGLAVAGFEASSARRAQAAADVAALAALDVMVGADGRPDQARISAATEVAAEVAAQSGATVTSIEASPDHRSVSLMLKRSRKGREVSATAKYIAPGAPIDADQVAELNRSALASRLVSSEAKLPLSAIDAADCQSR